MLFEFVTIVSQWATYEQKMGFTYDQPKAINLHFSRVVTELSLELR